MKGPFNLHEDTFYAYFEPYRHPESHFNIWNGIGLETFDEDFAIVQRMDQNYVWTVLDCDSGRDQWISPGMAFVNRICYLVARKPHFWIDIGFRVPYSLSSLTPIGLQRQTTQLKRLLAEKSAPLAR